MLGGLRRLARVVADPAVSAGTASAAPATAHATFSCTGAARSTARTTVPVVAIICEVDIGSRSISGGFSADRPPPESGSNGIGRRIVRRPTGPRDPREFS
ncbi:hypothetical protein [Actinokineospora diospyrosa]|uniref:Secreted protein n=1 Tax=Actinokineospora diospyrosa TaxID=103728 RepID=A0ABT1ICC3_9PSEU|nr:hypothetical protein [Actinokineospora diospyrosa]MCP2270285.1 hypothetical protein [Actinokineospora diospyrosa]